MVSMLALLRLSLPLSLSFFLSPLLSFQPFRVSQKAGAVEYTNCTSVDGYDPAMSALDMTLNNQMVRFL